MEPKEIAERYQVFLPDLIKAACEYEDILLGVIWKMNEIQKTVLKIKVLEGMKWERAAHCGFTVSKTRESLFSVFAWFWFSQSDQLLDLFVFVWMLLELTWCMSARCVVLSCLQVPAFPILYYKAVAPAPNMIG